MAPIAVLNALADATRCRIIEILQQGPVPVHKLAAGFDISRPAISRHLRVLKEAGLIREEKSGRENHYALQAKKLAPVRKWLDAVAPLKLAPVAADPMPETIAAPVVIAPTPQPEPEPAPETIEIAAKTKRPAPISQMGFDF